MFPGESEEKPPRFLVDIAGMCAGARWIPSPNCDERLDGDTVDLVILHNISLPPGEFGGEAIIDLFLNRLDANAHPYFADIAGLEVSAHFLIRRDGDLIQFVPCELRAWHAGASNWQGRERCNDFSVGIELEGLEGLLFEAAQYVVLARLLRALAARYPIVGVAGHEHVAAGRKHDPGTGFDWARLESELGWPAQFFPDPAPRAG